MLIPTHGAQQTAATTWNIIAIVQHKIDVSGEQEHQKIRKIKTDKFGNGYQ